MDFFSLLNLFGGLALFLYGMDVMGKALEKQSGRKLTQIMERLTSNKFKSLLLGAGVTAVIQSSSATTVMVVGLVNAGIMKLSQSVGVILGAKIGTTVTSWILSLSGIQGDSFLLSLFKPEALAPIFVVIGVIITMASKNPKKRDIAITMIGFAVLMYGMEMMSVAVEPLAQNETFQNILVAFTDPVLGFLCGLLVTMIIQSSSASVGILQVLSLSGTIPFAAAIPIIMGQNVGTCITAMIASIGTNKNARRAALIHLYSSAISAILFLILFYVVDGIFNFAFVDTMASPVSIAVFHSIYNVVAAFAWLPFTKFVEKLAYLTVRDDEEDDRFRQLDERFLSTPSFAIEQCRSLTNQMAELARKNLLDAITLLDDYNNEMVEEVLRVESEVDMYEDKIGTYLVKISGRDLTAEDTKEVSRLLHCIGDLERISDHAINIQQVAEEIREKEIQFSGDAKKELLVVRDAVKEVVSLAIDAFTSDDLTVAIQVEPLEQVVDLLKAQLKNHHITRLQAGECTIEMGFVFSDLVTNYERIADHCSNLAVCIIELAHGSFETHEYLNEVKRSDNQMFTKKFEEYKLKYTL
ncbi:MAG: Na/Pi cotransporter family protein [Oscillospiraceae bacterium]|nr:Na/Pi cotransporter family protein [Oscillospiraceae bacterium]